MVSVSCLKFVFSQFNVRFRSVVVLPCDGGLIYYRFLQAVSVKWACVLSSTVACFVVLGAGGGIVVVVVNVVVVVVVGVVDMVVAVVVVVVVVGGSVVVLLL